MSPRKSGIVIPHRATWYQRLLIAGLSYVARLLMASWRCRWDKPLETAVIEGPVIFCLWHNCLSLSIATWDRFAQAKWPAKGVVALISASKDGAILTEVVANFGIKTIRGSSSRRGAQSLLEATSWLEKKHPIAITPDGPRGPCYKIQPGIIQLAQVTGRPIVAFGYHIHRKIWFKSWDRFQVPLPFSRCDFRFADPIFVPRDATNDQREELRQRLENVMMSITTD